MIHTHTLKEAVLTAVPGALFWKNNEESCLDLQGLLALAEETDKEPLEQGFYYVVSREGAIGLADRFEYAASWLWLPLQGEELVSALTELGAQKKALADAADAVEPMPEEEKAAALAAAEPPEAPEPEQPAAEEPIPEQPAEEPFPEQPAEEPFPEQPAAEEPIPERPAAEPPFVPEPSFPDAPLYAAPAESLTLTPPSFPESPGPDARPAEVFSAEKGAYVIPAPEPEPAPKSEEPAPKPEEPVCPACGHSVCVGDRFCIFCGSPIAPKPAPEPAPKNAFCMNCGSPLKPGDRFCMNCGTKL